MGGICTKDIHLLKLSYNRRAVIGNGGADTRQYRIEISNLLLPVVEIGGATLQVDREFNGIQHADIVTAIDRGFLQTTGAVTGGASREYGELHNAFLGYMASNVRQFSDERG